ncbi:MAG: helix-turn-helix transcriptional regulator [Wenzhouxiangellaceae bacterium]
MSKEVKSPGSSETASAEISRKVSDSPSKDSQKDRLKTVRLQLNKTQREMSSLLGIGKNSWQNYESGRQQPGSAVVRALAQLGFDANWILTGRTLSAGQLVRERTAQYQDSGREASIAPGFIREAVAIVEQNFAASAAATKAGLVVDLAASLQKTHERRGAQDEDDRPQPGG